MGPGRGAKLIIESILGGSKGELKENNGLGEGERHGPSVVVGWPEPPSVSTAQPGVRSGQGEGWGGVWGLGRAVLGVRSEGGFSVPNDALRLGFAGHTARGSGLRPPP